MLNSFLIPGPIKFKDVGIVVKFIEVCHCVVDVGWEQRLRKFVVGSHVCNLYQNTCVGEGDDIVKMELLSYKASSSDACHVKCLLFWVEIKSCH